MHLAPLAFFLDLEMTGLDPARDAVVEIAIVSREGGTLRDEFTSLVSSPVPSNSASLALHGITAHDLEAAPKFPDITDRIGALSRAIPVAHGPTIDREFLPARSYNTA